MTNAPLAIDARRVSFVVGPRRLLDSINLPVAAGEVLALVGPNGAGKSTLLKILSGDLTATSGEVRLADRPLSDYRPGELALHRAVLPQQMLLQFAFTSREVVEMGRSPYRTRGRRTANDGQADDQAVSLAMDDTETRPLAHRVYPTLSGGEQGRVALARVLAQTTPILLLDEPTAALDLRHQQLVMEVARKYAARGAAVLAILHDLNLAAAYADRMAIISRGRLVAHDEPWAALDEKLLSDVFDCPISVIRHPVRGCPLVMPLPMS